MTTREEILTYLTALGYTNSSAVALFNKIAEAIGDTIDLTKTEFTNSEAIIREIIEAQRYGRSAYYTGKALAYQVGDSLTIDPVTLEPVYAVIDPTKYLVTAATFTELGELLFLKVAKTVSGELTPLTSGELAAFIVYFKNFELPGIPIMKISPTPEYIDLNVLLTVYSTFDYTELKANLKDAMNAFRQSIDYGGEFYTGDFEQYIKSAVPGIRDFYVYGTKIGDGSTMYSFTAFTALYAGYFNFDFDVDTFVEAITPTIV